jgi:polyphenol oxidase
MDFLQADNLKDLPKVRHGFFTRMGCVNLGDGASPLLTCQQVHSPNCVTVTDAWCMEYRPKADAMVTAVKGLALGILTADCVPVLFAHAKAEVIGAAHAGWRGAIGGVLANTIKAMEALGASRRGIVAALGPCIWQVSYEVGPEFPAPFLAEDPANEKLFGLSARAGHYLFDLPGYVVGTLRKLGVGDVEPSPADTFADETRFFSYRRDCLRGEASPGRLISAIALM